MIRIIFYYENSDFTIIHHNFLYVFFIIDPLREPRQEHPKTDFYLNLWRAPRGCRRRIRRHSRLFQLLGPHCRGCPGRSPRMKASRVNVSKSLSPPPSRIDRLSIFIHVNYSSTLITVCIHYSYSCCSTIHTLSSWTSLINHSRTFIWICRAHSTIWNLNWKKHLRLSM